MTWLIRILLVAGFCLGTLGAAGFKHKGSPEPGSVPLFVGGALALLAGGVLARVARKRDAKQAGGAAARRKEVLALLRAVHDSVVALEQKSASRTPQETRKAIDELVSGSLFDLTSANEEIATMLGFEAYARVWSPLANAERILARVWSLLTDGFPEEALAELPAARGGMEASLREGEQVLASA